MNKNEQELLAYFCLLHLDEDHPPRVKQAMQKAIFRLSQVCIWGLLKNIK